MYSSYTSPEFLWRMIQVMCWSEEKKVPATGGVTSFKVTVTVLEEVVWAGISVGGHINLHVHHGGTLTGVWYRDQILASYVTPYVGARGDEFILMDDNVRTHRGWLVSEYLKNKYGSEWNG